MVSTKGLCWSLKRFKLSHGFKITAHISQSPLKNDAPLFVRPSGAEQKASNGMSLP